MVAGRPNSISNAIGSPLCVHNSISNVIGRPFGAHNSISNVIGSPLCVHNSISNVIGRPLCVHNSIFNAIGSLLRGRNSTRLEAFCVDAMAFPTFWEGNEFNASDRDIQVYPVPTPKGSVSPRCHRRNRSANRRSRRPDGKARR